MLQCSLALSGSEMHEGPYPLNVTRLCTAWHPKTQPHLLAQLPAGHQSLCAGQTADVLCLNQQSALNVDTLPSQRFNFLKQCGQMNDNTIAHDIH